MIFHDFPRYNHVTGQAKYFAVSGPPKIHYQNLPKVVQRVNKLTISETQGLALSVKKTS